MLKVNDIKNEIKGQTCAYKDEAKRDLPKSSEGFSDVNSSLAWK